jgi:hypothetical protein
MNFRHRRHRPTESDLAALADRSLPASRRAGIERAVAASAELQADVAAQRRTLEAVHGVGAEPAPAALRARLELAHPPRRGRAARGRRGRARALTAVAASGLAAILVAAALLAVGTGGGLTVADASAVAVRPAQAPAPRPAGDGPALPGLRAAGLAFPYWHDAFGYRAVGVRRDRLAGREATTVFYVRAGARVAYTIVSGAPLPPGPATMETVRGGVWLRSLSAHGRTVVTWVRAGHSCVLTGDATTLPTLLRLASWRHGGELPYGP